MRSRRAEEVRVSVDKEAEVQLRTLG
jgi:hypothetical protein